MDQDSDFSNSDMDVDELAQDFYEKEDESEEEENEDAGDADDDEGCDSSDEPELKKMKLESDYHDKLNVLHAPSENIPLFLQKQAEKIKNAVIINAQNMMLISSLSQSLNPPPVKPADVGNSAAIPECKHEFVTTTKQCRSSDEAFTAIKFCQHCGEMSLK